jgi:hypothetical protein
MKVLPSNKIIPTLIFARFYTLYCNNDNIFETRRITSLYILHKLNEAYNRTLNGVIIHN